MRRRTNPTVSPRPIPRALSSGRRRWLGCWRAACSPIIGPQIVILTKDIYPTYLFAATYLAQSMCAVLAAAVLTLLRIPRPHVSYTLADGRPLAEIARQPKFLVAVVCGLASYAMMNMVMTSAPLAMVMCNHTVGDAALGLQWHVIGMYAPSFVTGSLIARFGVRRMMASGLTLNSGRGHHRSLRHRYLEFLGRPCGAGYRLKFCFHQRHHAGHRMSRPARAQQGPGVQRFPGVRLDGDRVVLVGALLARFGWAAVNEVVFPVILVAAVLLTWGSLVRNPRAA